MSQHTSRTSSRRSHSNTSIVQRQRRRSSSAHRCRNLARTSREQVTRSRNRRSTYRAPSNSTSARRTSPRNNHNLVSTLTRRRVTTNPRRNNKFGHTVTRRRSRSLTYTAGHRRTASARQLAQSIALDYLFNILYNTYLPR